LHSPRLAAGWNSWIGAVRAPAKLSYRHKELATCAVAILNGTEFEIARHAPAFIQEGGTPAQLDGMQQDLQAAMRNSTLFDATERAILELAFEITRQIRVREDVFHRARQAAGSDEAILELIAVITTYNMTTRFVIAFDLEVHGDPLPAAPDRGDSSSNRN
jgi:alkylhydroperoxidase family enzyme